jgi:hypothetical protein
VIELLADCRDRITAVEDRITAVEYSIFEKTENQENIFSSNKYVIFYSRFNESRLMTIESQLIADKSQLMTKESQLMTIESQLMAKEAQLLADKSKLMDLMLSKKKEVAAVNRNKFIFISR